MRKFVVINFKNKLKIVFQYDSEGILRILEFDGNWKAEQVKTIITRIPADLKTILIDIETQDYKKPWIFNEVTEVTFEAFYKAYPRHVGGKEQTEKAWKKLKEADQLEAILFIEELKKIKQGDNTAFPYPATYLNKKYWK